MAKKKAKVMLSSFSIILILFLVLEYYHMYFQMHNLLVKKLLMEVDCWCYFITGFDGTYTGI